MVTTWERISVGIPAATVPITSIVCSSFLWISDACCCCCCCCGDEVDDDVEEDEVEEKERMRKGLLIVAIDDDGNGDVKREETLLIDEHNALLPHIVGDGVMGNWKRKKVFSCGIRNAG